jgi:hypothetical protein
MSKKEEYFAKDAIYSYIYARDFIKGRFELGENAIAKDTEYSYYYAKEIIKGKLPEFMHNQMIANGIINPKDRFLRKYFDLIKLYSHLNNL